MSESAVKAIPNRLDTLTVHRQRLIAMVLMYVLILLSAWILGSLAWNILYTPKLSPWKPMIGNKSTVVSQGNDLSQLENSHLFGQYSQTEMVNNPKHDAPETRLNLTLVGVVASSNAKYSLAVIANRGQQAIYGIDERIEGTNATLISVLPDRAIISNQGNEEALMLEGIDYKKLNGQPITQQAVSQQKNTSVKVDNLDEIRAEIMENPQKAFDYIRLSQRLLDGKLIGYQVRPGNNRALFDEVGLQDGDVAVEMNSKDLTDNAQATELWKELATATSWDIVVERDGQRQEINITF